MICNYYYPLSYRESAKNDLQSKMKIHGRSIYFIQETLLKYFDNQTLDLNSYNV